MSRNAYVDYLHISGYLPRIERDRAVCWKGDILYLSGNPCYPGAPRYLTEAETREYMWRRFGLDMRELERKSFDYRVSGEEASSQVMAVTVTETGRILNLKALNMEGEEKDMDRNIIDATLKKDVDAPGIVGKARSKMAAIGVVGIALILAIGYLLMSGRK